MKLFVKHEKNRRNDHLTEKIFLQSIITSVTCILLCIFALCSASYAWFSESTKSPGNQIVAGTFDLEVSVVQNAAEPSLSGTAVGVERQGSAWICTLAEAGTYTVTLTRTSESTASGYCYVIFGEGNSFPTAKVVDEDFTFTVTVTQSTAVRFEPSWGIHANPSIFSGAELSASTLQQSTNG